MFVASVVYFVILKLLGRFPSEVREILLGRLGPIGHSLACSAMALGAPACTFCGAESGYALTAWDRNRETTPERFTYNRCTACGTLFMVDVPDDLSRYYAGPYHGFRPDGAPEWDRNPALLDVELFRMELLRHHAEPGTLIDIGAGAGAFAAAAEGRGLRRHGDPDG